MSHENIQPEIDDESHNDAEKGAVLCGLGGAAVGGLAGSLAGPVGAFLGALAGGLAGAGAGGAAVNVVDHIDHEASARTTEPAE